MDGFIAEFENSIPKELCDEIINTFEMDHGKHQGQTISGVNYEYKISTDLTIPKNNLTWKNIEVFLYKELSKKLSLYLKKNKKDCYGENFSFFSNKQLICYHFNIQKYEKNIGKYAYHVDSSIGETSNRAITFIWYLNTLQEGGETVFWDNQKVKPETGKLLFFPACWCYPHMGSIPISSSKYIITGFLYFR